MSLRFPAAGQGPLVLVLHGPNLGALGRRDPALYGSEDLDGIMDRLAALAGALGVAVEGLQSDQEGELVAELLAAHGRGVAAAVLNPGALAHTSYAVRDAVEAAGIPVVEVHLSNVHRRERWRHRLAIAPATAGVVAGFGPASYELGLRAAADLLRRSGGSGGLKERSGSPPEDGGSGGLKERSGSPPEDGAREL
jgi:3-dehydroquinate dehydratase II